MKIYDKDIRKLLFNKFLKTEAYTSDPSTIIVPEMDVCSGLARIDIAVINGKIHGYEIKSKQDNLERLPSQIKYYNKIFDTMTIVITENHYQKAKGITPNWWGIYCVVNNNYSNPFIKIEREPIQNKNNTEESNLIYITQILWKNELLEMLNNSGIVKGIKNKSRFELAKIICNNIEKDLINTFIRKKLKHRKAWKAVLLQQLCDDLLLS